ncbi:hypothetical protein BPAE_0077g00120 [Botrytis paeoniae]|uniref:Uncharacterized protein n=1 Tax=Botrytis paeoniae TaxID=278948 RepID=A0A4Z1FLP0_9HELO|nr:hypothetical protein BPAE_0077g00120 [Botrytis paeoniae]
MTLLSISAGKISVELQAMTPDTFSMKSEIKLLFMAQFLYDPLSQSCHFDKKLPVVEPSALMFSAASFLSKVYEPPNGKPGYASMRYTKSVIPELIKVPKSLLNYSVVYSGPTIYCQNIQILLAIASKLNMGLQSTCFWPPTAGTLTSVGYNDFGLFSSLISYILIRPSSSAFALQVILRPYFGHKREDPLLLHVADEGVRSPWVISWSARQSFLRDTGNIITWVS